ncbi:MAG TPA: methyl-viologen-reducing hydrogenase subunit delta, partial [Syntrophobacteraceae bacterium]|nr:methyl-viologen-reducing hydrogenase subunit delta [Syntrophobacteraceae bacterium]
TCRYGSGTDNTTHNVESTRGILEMLGIGKERLRWATFLPEDADGLLRFLQNFQKDVQVLGKNPVIPPVAGSHAPSHPRPPSVLDEPARKLLAEHDIYACQECGKCSSACPITLVGKPFSPRAMAGRIIASGMSDPAVDADIWSCLTCGLCHDRCPSAIDFPEFIRELRALESPGGSVGHEAHGGFFQSLMRTMTSPDLRLRHWDWLPDDVRTDPDSKILFFGGCAPYFDIFFRQHLGVQTSDILVDSLRLLNFFDITPAILTDERCCGHDLLWSGDRENFRKLARLNVDAIAALGVEEVVTACPECFRTLGHDYREQGVEPPFRVTHLYELLEREIDKGAIAFEPMGERLTFQDPCR